MSNEFGIVVFDYQLNSDLQKQFKELFNINPEERFVICSNEDNKLVIFHSLELKKNENIDNKESLDISFISNKPKFSEDFEERILQISKNINEYVQRLGKDTPKEE